MAGSPPKRTLIAVPVRDLMATATAKSLCAAVKAGFDVVFATGGGLPNARNSICRGAIDQGYHAVLQVDSDMVFLPEHVLELVRHAESEHRSIVSGRYFARSQPHQPHAYRDGRPVRGTVAHNQSEPVDYTGAGFLYTTTEALRRIPEPWFDHSHKQGEDAYFCHKATAAGLTVWYYPWVTLGHVGTIMYSDPQYEKVLGK